MIIPEHIKVNRPVGLSLNIGEYDMNSLYQSIRLCTKTMKTNAKYYETEYEGRSCSCDCIGLHALGVRGVRIYGSREKTIDVQFKHTGTKYQTIFEYQNEVKLEVSTSDGVGCMLHYNVAYAIVSKVDEKSDGDYLIEITFYNKKDEVVISLKQNKRKKYGGAIRCRCGKYMLSSEIYAEENKKNVGGGCFYCNHSSYVKDGGVIYISCNKYDGRVAEVDYTGEDYPAYCKRRR